jgi:Calcium binding
MPEKNQPFKIGDSVKVKPNTDHPDYGGDISGRQGRVTELYEDTVMVEWDSVTLARIPSESIRLAEDEGDDWTMMGVTKTELELTIARDTPEDVEDMLDHLEHIHQWDFLGEEGPRIQKVLKDVDSDDELSAFEAWEKHFRKVLKFPFEAEVMEQQKGAVRQGDVVKVLEITEIMEPYGVLVQCSHKRGGCVLPLCDLEVTKESSPNYQPVKDHAVWFANHL